MPEPRPPDKPCGAEWSTDFYDTYSGLRATCDKPDHDGVHEGPVTTWDGGREKLDPTTRLTWLNELDRPEGYS